MSNPVQNNIGGNSKVQGETNPFNIHQESLSFNSQPNMLQSHSNIEQSNLIIGPEDLNSVHNLLEKLNSHPTAFNSDNNNFMNGMNINFQPPNHHLHFNTPQWGGLSNGNIQNELDLLANLPDTSYNITPGFNGSISQFNHMLINIHSGDNNHGLFTPPVYQTNNLFSPVFHPYDYKFMSLPNSGNLNMISQSHLTQQIPPFDFNETNNLAASTNDFDMTHEKAISILDQLVQDNVSNASVILPNIAQSNSCQKYTLTVGSRTNNQDKELPKSTSVLPNTIKYTQDNDDYDNHKVFSKSDKKLYDVVQDKQSFKKEDVKQHTLNVFTPMKLMNTDLIHGTGLGLDSNQPEPFFVAPIPTSKLRVAVPPTQVLKSVTSFNEDTHSSSLSSGLVPISNPVIVPFRRESTNMVTIQENNESNIKGIDYVDLNRVSVKDLPYISSEKSPKASNSKPKSKGSISKIKKGNYRLSRPLISPAIMPAVTDVTLSANELLTKSNYQLIVEGNSAALGLNYDPGFELNVRRKRQHHQASEQKRRAALAAMFKSLSSTLVNCEYIAEGQSQSSIISHAYKGLAHQCTLFSLRANLIIKLRQKLKIPSNSEEHPFFLEVLPKLNLAEEVSLKNLKTAEDLEQKED